MKMIDCICVLLCVFSFSFYGMGIDTFPSFSLSVAAVYFYEAISR